MIGVVLMGAVVMAACSDSDDDAGGAVDDAAEFTYDALAEEANGGDDGGVDDDLDATGAAAPAVGESGPGAEQASRDFDLGAVGRDVIIEMRVRLSSDNMERTVSSVMASAAALGGGVASSDVDYGVDADDRDGYAVLVLKVPPESVDRLLAGLDDTATVQSISQSARDVTEQLVDLDVRISNARQSVASVREFMDRTENLNELVTLEAELTRRQTQLEQLEAQQRNLSDRVALSTITVEVVPTAAVPSPTEPDEDDGVVDALRSGWEAFAAVVVGLVIVLAAMLPFLVTAGIVAVAAWLVVRRRNGGLSRRAGADDDRPVRDDPPAEAKMGDTADDREPEPVS